MVLGQLISFVSVGGNRPWSSSFLFYSLELPPCLPFRISVSLLAPLSLLLSSGYSFSLLSWFDCHKHDLWFLVSLHCVLCHTWSALCSVPYLFFGLESTPVMFFSPEFWSQDVLFVSLFTAFSRPIPFIFLTLFSPFLTPIEAIG